MLTKAVFQGVERITKILAFAFGCSGIVQKFLASGGFTIEEVIERHALHNILN